MKSPNFWSQHERGMQAIALEPIAQFLGLLSTARYSLVKPRKVKAPVICVGNLVAGGAGKTPTAISIAGLLREKGINVSFLTRGYGGKEQGPIRVDLQRHNAAQVGDEPILLAHVAPTWVSRNRILGAKLAISEGAKVLIMDDGFQNPYLTKDFSIIVIDGGYGFGNNRLIPAGPLRETIVKGLPRADAIVLIGQDKTGVLDVINKYELPTFCAKLIPTLKSRNLQGKTVVAFSGIGRPSKFFFTLRDIGCTIIKSVSFPDHHHYKPAEIMKLVEYATSLGAIPVTTEKDWVRLPFDIQPMIRSVSVILEWENSATLLKLINPKLRRNSI